MLKEQASVICGFEVWGESGGSGRPTPYALYISTARAAFNGRKVSGSRALPYFVLLVWMLVDIGIEVNNNVFQ
jgi:hypothetical protein